MFILPFIEKYQKSITKIYHFKMYDQMKTLTVLLLCKNSNVAISIDTYVILECRNMRLRHTVFVIKGTDSHT